MRRVGSAQEVKAVTGKRNVLVLDGDPAARNEIAAVLTENGYTVEATGSGKTGVQKLKEHPFTCAVVDVKLEDMSGIAAIGMLREIDPDMAIIAMAQENSKGLEAQVREQTVVYYYVKSFDREELVQAVGGAAGGRHVEKKAKILVVDDDRDYQLAVKHILESAGYEVGQAFTKEDGLQAVKTSTPDLIILDIMMTKTTDGFHFLYEIKSDEKFKDVPVLSASVISKETGFAFSPTGKEGYFPADDFMVKPMAPAELLSHVEALLAGERPAGSDA